MKKQTCSHTILKISLWLNLEILGFHQVCLILFIFIFVVCFKMSHTGLGPDELSKLDKLVELLKHKVKVRFLSTSISLLTSLRWKNFHFVWYQHIINSNNLN